MRIKENEEVRAIGDFFTVREEPETGIHSISSNNDLTFRGVIESGSSDILGQQIGANVICLKSALVPVTKDLFLVHKDHILAIILKGSE